MDRCWIGRGLRRHVRPRFPGLRIAGGGNLQETLKDSGPGSGSGRKHERLRSILVVTEVALACVLLVGAGLLLRSFLKVLDVDLGFEPQHAAAISVDFDNSSSTREGALQKQTQILHQVLTRVSSIPGIQAVGIVDYLPLGQNRSWGTPFPKGVKPPNGLTAGPLVYVITPGYMRAMGTGIRGRDFTWDDGPKSTNVVMINKTYARFLANYAQWPDGSAVGQMLNDRHRMTCSSPACRRRCPRRGHRGRYRLADLLSHHSELPQLRPTRCPHHSASGHSRWPPAF